MPGRRNIFTTLKTKAQSAMSRFLYDERGSGYGSGAYVDDDPPFEAEERPRRGRRVEQRQAAPEQQAPQAWQQAPYQGMQGMDPQQGGYSQPYVQMPPQPEQQPISQFSAQIAEQQNRADPQNRARQQNPQIVQFPGAYEQQPQEAPQPQWGLCVLNLRTNAECRLAISMLRQGNALLVIMENVGDSAEMRRYVDTLSGACFSLNATITKVSRHGAYLLAPGSVNVMADSATSQMNSVQRRSPAAAPRRQANPYAPETGAFQPSYQNPISDNGFEYRTPAPEPQQPAFYMRQPQQAPATPAFDRPQPGTGYVPDQREAVN